jgi:hypothetical protein
VFTIDSLYLLRYTIPCKVHREEGLKRVLIRFYCTDSGNEPVRKWLKSLAPEDRKDIGVDLQTLEFGWPIGMPFCAAL